MSPNTIVYFSFPPKYMLTATEIMEYFEEIGEQINSVRLYGCYGFAKFRRSSSVQRVHEGQHSIRGSTLTVCEHPYGTATDWYEEVSGTSILWLNDDCLEKVFGYLNENDLCSVADTCKRFKYNAQSEYQLHRPHFLHYGNSHQALLRNFGAFVEGIVLHSPAYFDRLVEMIARYCGPMLTSLRLRDVRIQDDDTIQFLRPISSRLRYLDIENCGNSFDSLMSSCSMLREFRIAEYRGIIDPTISQESIASSLQRNFPQLTTVTLYFSDLKTADVANFLKWNPQLRRLDCETGDNGAILEAIAQHVPQIEAITFFANSTRIEPKFLQSLNQLHALHTVTIDIMANRTSVGDLINGLVAANLSITTFGLFVLQDTLNDEITGGICKLQNIKTFKFSGRIFPTDEFLRLKHICKNLPDLEDLQISIDTVDKNIFADQIIQLISCAKKITSLKIKDTEIELDFETAE